MLLEVCSWTLQAWARVSSTCFSTSSSILILPYQAFSPGTSTNSTRQVHPSIQLCHHFHLRLISTLVHSVLLHHPPHLSFSFGAQHSQLRVRYQVSGPHKDIFTSSHPHPLYQPISLAHLHPSGLSHSSHRPMLSSPPSPLPYPHPHSSLLLLLTAPHHQPLIVRHHPGSFILPNPHGLPICCPNCPKSLMPVLDIVIMLWVLTKLPQNCLVPVSDIPSVLCVPVRIFSLLFFVTVVV